MAELAVAAGLVVENPAVLSEQPNNVADLQRRSRSSMTW
jgi:hypothetical protein